jgi:hypothetical protein
MTMRKRWIVLGVAVAVAVAVTAGIALAASRGPAAPTSTGQAMVQACDVMHDSQAMQQMYGQMPAALRAQCDAMHDQMDQMMGGSGQGMMGGSGQGMMGGSGQGMMGGSGMMGGQDMADHHASTS